MNKRNLLGALAVSVALAGTIATFGGVSAQQPQTKAKQPAAAAPAAGAAQQQSAWVKLCEKAPFARLDKDRKEVREEKNICLTHHERLDGNTGMVLVSAALRQIEGVDKQHMMVMVPLGMAIAPGLKAAVYAKDLWDKVQKNEQIDEKQLKPIDLKFTICHPAGCTAEIEADNAMVEQMKSGGGIMILAINAAAQPIGFPVPLVGFAQAHGGAPVDNKVYGDARIQLMQQIRQRQIALIEEAQKRQAAVPGLPPPQAPAGATGSTTPAAPAAKKP